MKRFVSFIPIPFIIGIGIFFVACTQQPKEEPKSVEATDPLPSWNNTPTKNRIVTFVKDVTMEGNPLFVPVKDRIAVFDNDGTLWCEQPLYFEVVYSLLSTKQ